MPIIEDCDAGLDELREVCGDEYVDSLPKKPSLKDLNWLVMCEWLSFQILTIGAKKAVYERQAKNLRTDNLDGQIKYWKNQLSLYKSLIVIIRQANGG